MIVVVDSVGLKERGKYKGMLGSAIAVGGGILSVEYSPRA